MLFSGCGEETSVDLPSCPDGTTWSFIVIGDTRSNPDIFGQHIENINGLSPAPELFLHTGDMVTQFDLDIEWSIFHSVMKQLKYKIPFHPAVGNHDVTDDERTREIYKIETGVNGPLYYSFYFRSVLFIVLSTPEKGYTRLIAGDQLDWLKSTLTNSNADRIIVLLHVPLFPQGHDRGKGVYNAGQIHDLFIRYGVSIVFAGHEHQFFFNEFDGISYVITGGGGAPLYHENGGDFYHFVRACCGKNQIHLQVIGLDGKLISAYQINKNSPKKAEMRVRETQPSFKESIAHEE